MALIGINGKIGSGKDTVGLIIQYLDWYKAANSQGLSTNMSFEEWLKIKTASFPFNHKHWEIKKFAGKLKQIVCLLTGATLEQLEDQEFKKQKLGSEWTKYNHNWTYREESEENSDYELINKDKKLYRYKGMDTLDTYRDLLQKLGTEAMRNVIHENVWVNALMADYGKYINQATGEQVLINDYLYYKNGLDSKAEIVTKQEPNWVITDMRFPNEMYSVIQKGGITIRVNRTNRWNKPQDIEHSSETALDHAKFDYVIDNDGSISDLIEKVREILTKNNIIK